MNELNAKYAAAAETVRKMVIGKVEDQLDQISNTEFAHSVIVMEEDEDSDSSWSVYDRLDSILDQEAYGPQTTPLWVIVDLNSDGDHTIQAPTLEEAVTQAIKVGWLTGRAGDA